MNITFVYWMLFAAVVACIGAMFDYSYLSFPSLATGVVIISHLLRTIDWDPVHRLLSPREGSGLRGRDGDAP